MFGSANSVTRPDRRNAKMVYWVLKAPLWGNRSANQAATESPSQRGTRNTEQNFMGRGPIFNSICSSANCACVGGAFHLRRNVGVYMLVCIYSMYNVCTYLGMASTKLKNLINIHNFLRGCHPRNLVAFGENCFTHNLKTNEEKYISKENFIRKLLKSSDSLFR